ncbi:MAG: heparinase II/III family protein [Acidobacteria bacterium OLB17]|nr:MAG: heparinase II/III family protein [Acidobacteria bacterium OLB17]MCZ2389983.1 heparinase II/III family protein [Acidobacteriota bacterium]
MTTPFKALKKIRQIGFDELRTRGTQLVSAYRDRITGVEVPDRTEFFRLLDDDARLYTRNSAESVRQRFFENSRDRFFASMREDLAPAFSASVSTQAAEALIREADAICDGKLNILGYANVEVGTEIDWHREPISGTVSPRIHWKEFNELDHTESGDKRILWELNRHQHFFTLGAAYRLTGDERYAELFARQIASWIRENPPGIGANWVSSLEIAFRSISWIWALALFRDSAALTSDLLLDCVRLLYVHGRHIETYLSTYYSPNTHLTGEALGLYYLGTQLPFLEAASEWRRRGEDILLTEIAKQIGPDGVYFEQSSWYQRYTVDFYLHFYVLRELYGETAYDERNVVADERLNSALTFLLNIARPDGTTPLIGDDDGGRLLPHTNSEPADLRGTLSLGAAVFGRRDLAFGGADLFAETFWLLGSGGVRALERTQAHEPDTLSREFPDGGYFVMRNGWMPTDDALVIDCGELGALSGAHGHADLLSIDLSLRGRQLFIDPGTFSYSGSPEKRERFRSSAAHNTLTVDGRSTSMPAGPFSWKTRAAAIPKEWITESNFDYFEGDGELPAGGTHTRSILYVRGDYFIIRDVASVPGEHLFELNFRYSAEVAAEKDLEGEFVGDRFHRTFVFGTGALTCIPDQVSPQYGRLQNATRVRYAAKERDRAEFVTFVIPTDENFPPPEVSEVPIDAGRMFLIQFSDYRDVLLLGQSGIRIRTESISSDFGLTWARTHSTSDLPEQLIAVNGSRMSIVSSPIVRQDEPVRSVAARRFGRELYVNADGERQTVKLTDLPS